jgi:tryptophanyl-tRNA synthetase
LFLTPEENETLRKRYQAGGLSYKDAKEYLYEKIIAFIKPIQEKYAKIKDKEIINLVKKNTESMKKISEKKINEIYKKIGFSL